MHRISSTANFRFVNLVAKHLKFSTALKAILAGFINIFLFILMTIQEYTYILTCVVFATISISTSTFLQAFDSRSITIKISFDKGLTASEVLATNSEIGVRFPVLPDFSEM
jgi:hypothetical protein